jgi:hypothetical protein
MKAAGSHDRLVAELLGRQCGVDIIDDDLLSDPLTGIEDGELHAGAMHYSTILVGDVCWMAPESLEKLRAFADSGGQVLCDTHAPGTAGTEENTTIGSFIIGTPTELAARVPSLISLSPGNTEIRACARTCNEGEVLFLFNEGGTSYQGEFRITQKSALLMDPLTGQLAWAGMKGDAVTLRLLPGESALFLLTDEDSEAALGLMPTEDRITIDATLTAIPRRQFVVGQHDFEIEQLNLPVQPFDRARVWRDWLGDDFSGEVDYVADVVIPPSWDRDPVRLCTGPIEYAATVFVDDTVVGSLLWAPWRLDLPPLGAGTHHIVIRVANTLANELTSQRVEDLWSQKKGDGWPSPYHVRAFAFERESRGGGLKGPVVVERLRKAPGKP